MTDGAYRVLCEMADAVDAMVGAHGHSRRVEGYVAAALPAFGLGDDEAAAALAGARLHDIGKLGLPRAAFEGALTSAGGALVRAHPRRGADFLSGSAVPDAVRDVVLRHHERADGRGYPGGLRAAAIPMPARLVAVADGFDVLARGDARRRPVLLATAMAVLREGAGTRWDRTATALFLACMPRLLPLLEDAQRPTASPSPIRSASA